MTIAATAWRVVAWVVVGLAGFLALSLLLGAVGGALWPYEGAGVARSAVGGAMGLLSVALVLGIFGVPALLGVAIAWVCMARVVPILERDRTTTVTLLSLLSVTVALLLHLAFPEEPPLSYLVPMLWIGVAAPRLVVR